MSEKKYYRIMWITFEVHEHYTHHINKHWNGLYVSKTPGELTSTLFWGFPTYGIITAVPVVHYYSTCLNLSSTMYWHFLRKIRTTCVSITGTTSPPFEVVITPVDRYSRWYAQRVLQQHITVSKTPGELTYFRRSCWNAVRAIIIEASDRRTIIQSNFEI